MQLVAYGAQDIYLTGNPQITFFKVVYRRYTNFAIEAIEQTFNGTTNYGSRVTATISRNGDLIHRCYLQCSAEAFGGTRRDNDGKLSAICANLGTAIVDEISVEIGGQQIDRHYGHWMETWSELTEPNSSGTSEMLRFGAFPCNNFNSDDSSDSSKHHNNALYSGHNDDNKNPNTFLKGFGTKYQVTSLSGGICGPVVKLPKGKEHNLNSEIQPWFLPLQFWFCRHAGLALPLIALQYHEVRIVLHIQALCALSHNALSDDCLSVSLWVDYIYLDTDERRRFAQVSHEYLIEQLQFINANSRKTCIDLTFNHPVKEIIWIGAPCASVSRNCKLIDQDSYYSRVPNEKRYPYHIEGEDTSKLWEGPNPWDTSEVPSDTNTVENKYRNAIITGAYYQGPSTPTSIINECPSNLGRDGPEFILKLNGHDRFSARDYRYFTRAQVWQYHSGYGGIELRSLFVENELLLNSQANTFDGFPGPLGNEFLNNSFTNGYSGFDQVNIPTMGDTIGVYSFALKPEEHQPSGTCNFSRIDTAQLCINCGGDTVPLFIYAINYNVLRIMSGMGGLAYSN